MRSSDSMIEAMIGYAADEAGKGLVYALLRGSRTNRLLRIGFRVAGPARLERAIGYAALTAVTRALSKRGVRHVRFILADRDFVEEIATGRGVGETLALAYVRLRCSLNALPAFDVRAGATDDLTQRARAEMALNVAA